MGLDQYAKAVKGLQNEDGEWDQQYELAYWRKHPNLQGYMENLWRQNGGEGVFNCEEVELQDTCLDELERTIKASKLPPTEGFFFGPDSDEEYYNEDLQFIANARKALADGYRIMYSSWW